MTLHEDAFAAMGTHVRLLATPGAPLEAARARLESLAARLTRFDPASELCRLNADPRPVVPASATLRTAVRAALAGAELTGGLADPTLLGAMERAGYARSLVGCPRASLTMALAAAPPRRPAAPAPQAAWRAVSVRDADGTIERPPGLRLDLGGSAKGLIADALAAMLGGHGPCAVDCGGDVRVTGRHEVHVLHPISGESLQVLALRGSAVATSGIGARVWWDAGGRPAHHLLDPSTGEPAWTGLVAATALAPTAVEAEALAKAALLAGPVAGRRLLRRHGGVLVGEDGSVDLVGAAARPRVVVGRGEIACVEAGRAAARDAGLLA
jgi:thiamine biosynthesis lipoprotein